MVSNADCVFCKILKGEIPSFKVYDDDHTYGFMDINPANAGHVLVIPKYHAPNIYEIPKDWVSDCMITAQKIAKAVHEVTRPDGINILQANGEGAAQSVHHFHIHVLPRSNDDGLKMNWELVPGDMDEIAALAEKIKSALA
ncbi:Histidine triad (HIT) protein [Candidatus Terasakiella magnetica]|uniref:Histidine triad (HIT) protein n=1 Tax=Candidatus Terasakiella magnetica TaxID=1867952 RepID=A0A1C3RKB8_9PROT|nr:HIT family protein [Candidatus Terasakiella magnetica]SCA57661.1 Histidine triad (HIT) protein [Candidatus Terasakiella magnetica]